MTGPDDRVFVISQLPPPTHGSTVMTQVLLRTLTSLGYAPRLIDRRFSASLDEVGRFSARKVISGLGLVCRAGARLVGRRRSRLVFFTTTRPASFLVDWMASELARLGPRQRVNYLHTRGYRQLAERGRLWRFLVRRLLTSATDTVCLGPSLADDVEPWVDPANITFIPNTPLDVPEYGDAEKSTNPREVLFLSNLIPEKGPEEFIDIAAQLSDITDVTFLMAGAEAYPGQIDEYRRRAEELGLSDRLTLLGRVGPEKKWDLLRRATLLIFPSRLDEAQPLTIIEAYAMGTPTLAHDVGGIRDLLPDEGPGARVPSKDSTLMADSARRLLTSSKHNGQQRATHKQFSSRYSLEAFTSLWDATLSPSH